MDAPIPGDPVAGGPAPDRSSELDALLVATAQMGERQEQDPFGNPVLGTALLLSRRLEEGSLTVDTLRELVLELRDRAMAGRAARVARYVGLDTDPGGVDRRLRTLAERLARPDPDDSPVPLLQFRNGVERTRFAAVFTAHPTFALREDAYAALAAMATGAAAPEPGAAPEPAGHDSQRPAAPTLEDEFRLATTAIGRGRDALDRFNRALLAAAAAIWPQGWATLRPRPIVLASWVGYDTDGRTDIGWWDTLRLRLRMKRLGLERLREQAEHAGASALAARLADALGAVDIQIAAAPASADPAAVAAFAAALVDEGARAIRDPAELDAAFTEAIAVASGDARIELAVARAGLAGHGLSLAHTHVRLNANQIHNVARQRLGIEDSPENPSQRRALLAAVNEALDAVSAVPVDFGALLGEQATAARLMMAVAQITKHVDRATPVRFLIAETESGYTLLVALWLAKLFGVADRVEISPLFETREAMVNGARVVEEALRSKHYRDYLRASGRMALQFGYSDSGRYVGQLAATYLVERLRLKIADLLHKRGLADVEVVLFDTHGESIGRGAHPFHLSDRLDYLSTPRARHTFAQAGIACREETAFQGGDGYLLFGSAPLADAVVATIAEHCFAPLRAEDDPIYDEPDFSADFFSAISSGMEGLVEDPGYAALLGAFGPALIDRTGSRPAARQTDGAGARARIRHPSELRAIPNNAILQQLGWCANTLQGLGSAAARHPETFESFLDRSDRFRRALDFAAHALAHSDRDVLRAIVLTLDPGTWLDRAAHEPDPNRREALGRISSGLERLNLWADTQSMFRRIQADHLALRAAWPDAPRMATPELLLHAIRLAVIERLWLLCTRIPYFSPRDGFSREALEEGVLRLEIPNVLEHMAHVFPAQGGTAAPFDFREAAGPRRDTAYSKENTEIFGPMRALFELLREISVAVMHENGAFG